MSTQENRHLSLLGTGILCLLHVDYWAYTTERQLLQPDIQLESGFNVPLLMPKPGLIF